jgi:CubicO group peptidase (beta-lactamase class C family)
MSEGFSRRALLGSVAAAGFLAAGKPRNKPDTTPKSAAQEKPGPAPLPERPYAFLDALLPGLLAQAGVPGISVAVIRNDQLVHESVAGLANVALNRPVTPATIFQAASLTKPVFTYAALKLCDRGQLGLDTPLVSYIPQAGFSRDPRVLRITPRMVLSHTSGLPNWASGKRPLKIEFEPGAHFGYSGEAFNVLQEAVETLSNRPLNDLLTNTVSKPYGLHESAFTWRDEFEATAALGYEWDGTPVRSRSKPDEAMAASSFHTTARDYAKFMIASLAPGQQGPEALDYVTKRAMLSPQVRLAGPLSWGLGWALLLREEGDIHWHFGDSRGYMSYAAMSRATGNGVVIFTNGRHGLRVCHAVANGIFDNHDSIFSWIYDVFYEGKLPQWGTKLL